MFFSSTMAKVRGARVSKISRESSRRRVLIDAATRGIEQLEERWLLAVPNAFSANFVGNTGTTAVSMDPGDVAGVVPEGDFNNLTVATQTTAFPLMDRTGSTAAGTTATWSAPGFWASQHNAVVPATPDQKLNDGFVYSGGSNTPVSVSIKNIPFATYDVYVYILNDGGGRLTTTTANGTSYYLTTATGPGDANHVSGVANTYQYVRATSTNSASPTANGDYVLFPGQTGSAFTFTSSAAANGSVNGFQIVEVLPPDAPVLSTPTVSHNVVDLNWSSVGPSGSVTYSVFRSDAAHPTPVAIATGLTGLSYGDGTVLDGTPYTYFVKGVSAAGSSAASNSQTATPNDGVHALSVNFRGGGNGQGITPLASTDIAGIFPVANYTNARGFTGTNIPLVDSDGASTGATLTYVGAGTGAAQAGPIVPGNGDQALNEGFVAGDSTVTVTNIPFSHYSVYVYELSNTSGQPEITTANGTSYYGTSADPADGSHINSTNTPYLYTQTTSTDSGNPTAGGDYVKFSGLTSASFTFTTSAGLAGVNGYLNGFQIVDDAVAAPAAPVLNDPTTGFNAIGLTWSGLDAYTYTIFRSDAAHPVPTAIASNVTGLSYVDNTAVNGTPYTYYITGTNTIGTSPQSNTKIATAQNIAPVAPVLTGGAFGANTEKLNWNTVPFASTYTVKRATALGGPFTDLASGLVTPAYTDSTATGTNTYYYAVVAVNGGGSSPLSNVVYTANNLNAIGVNFNGGGNGVAVPMAPTDSAGVYPTTNYNNMVGGSGTNTPLRDNNGALIGSAPTMTVTSGGTYNSTGTVPANGDQALNNGFIFGNASVTVSNIPFGHYDVYIYELNDAAGRVETTTANGVKYYGVAATPTDANHVSGVANTYLYTQSTSTEPGDPTPNGDWVLFSNQTGTTFTFTTSAPGNGYLNGFQIVNHPIAAPAAPVVIDPPVINNNYVRLSWTDPDGVSYNVYRSDAAHPVAAAVATNITSTSFIDTTVTSGTAYTYYVVASNPYGTSGNSNNVIVTPKYVAPTDPASNVAVSRTNSTTTVVTWIAPEFAETFDIQRATSLDGTYTTIASNLTALTYTDTTANTDGNVDYFYKVISKNPAGPGPISSATFVGHGTGLTGSYYTSNQVYDTNNAATIIRSGSDGAAVLSFVRTDPTINMIGAGGTTAPPGVPSNWNTIQGANIGQDFAVRWTGYVEAPVTGYYTFFPSSDDGIRVLYNNSVLAPSNLTAGRGLTEDTVPVTDVNTNAPVLFTAGQRYLIQVDYNNGGGAWGVQLRWGASSTTNNEAAHVYDAMSKQFVPTYNEVPPTPSFATVDALGVESKDQAYYTFTSTGLKLSWHDIGADSYNIYRSTSFGGPFTKVNSSPILGNATAAGGQDTYVDTDPTLVNGTTYFYNLTGVNGSGETPIDLNTGITTGGLSLIVTPLVITGTAGNDFIYVSEDPNTFGQIDYWVRNTAFATSPVGTIAPTGTINAFSVGGAVNILGGGGTDVITLDLSHGDIRPDTSVPIIIANSSSTTTLSLVGAGAGDTLQIDPQSLVTGGLAGTYFQVNGNSVSLDLNNVDTIKVGASTTVNAYSGNAKVDAGTSATVAVNVFGASGAITLAANQHLQSLTVNGGVANITGVVDVDSMFVDPSAKVNVNNTLKVHYTGGSVLPTILAMLKTGRNNGTWDGLGISSTSAHASGIFNVLGYKDDGASVVTVKYVFNGDSDLSGGVSFADLVAVAQHYGLSNGSATWATGDFNYDGNVSFADLVAVAQNYGKSLPAAPAAPVASAVVSAPVETASVASAPVQTTPAKPAPITSKPISSPAVAAAPVAAVVNPVVTTTPPPVVVAKPVAKPVSMGASVNLSKPVAVTPPAVKPVKVTAPTPFAPTTQFRSQNQATSLVGNVLEKKPGGTQQLFV